MRILIIEDELIASKDLAFRIRALMPYAEISGTVFSVAEAKQWFKNNPLPDLIFSDIELGDGRSFEIFDGTEWNVPVIFVTAYNHYAIESFKTNAIDYILKPFNDLDILNAIEKVNRLGIRNTIHTINSKVFRNNEPRKLLLHSKDKIIPVGMDEIALITKENEVTYIWCLDQRRFHCNYTLDELEQQADALFFRANRQVLVNRKNILSVTPHFSRRLYLNLQIASSTPITVSKEKASEFLNWLATC